MTDTLLSSMIAKLPVTDGKRKLTRTGGYSGRKDNRYPDRDVRVHSTHLTAKTRRSIPCIATPSAAAAIANMVERSAMLKARQEKRA